MLAIDNSCPSVLCDLMERGFIDQLSNRDAIQGLLSSQLTRIYVGFDPTADSLHVGSLPPLMALAHFQRSGHQPIIVIGGATGMIGDPSGRSTERKLLTDDVVLHNSKKIQTQMERFLSFSGSHPAIMVNNADWTNSVTLIDFLRNVGKHFTINYMMAKESVKRRLETPEQGISFTEFSYPLLQAHDFLHLYQTYNCLIQAGGSDQWGNITSGIELVRRTCGAEVYGVTFPLITTSTGEKFGKSAGNAIWLDGDKTSPYQLYQFWMQTDDRDVERYLKLFTFLSLDQIQNVCQIHAEAPEERKAQKTLASEVTKIVHGEQALRNAVRTTEILFKGKIADLSDKELKEAFSQAPSTNLPKELLISQISILDLLVDIKLCNSRGESRRLVQGGGLYLNGEQVLDVKLMLSCSSLILDNMLVLRAGKKSYHVVYFS